MQTAVCIVIVLSTDVVTDLSVVSDACDNLAQSTSREETVHTRRDGGRARWISEKEADMANDSLAP